MWKVETSLAHLTGYKEADFFEDLAVQSCHDIGLKWRVNWWSTHKYGLGHISGSHFNSKLAKVSL